MPSTEDDYRRLRLAAESARPARADRDATGAPAILGRVTTPGMLGAGRFFTLRPYTITGPEVEGGTATLTASESGTVLVLARGEPPPGNGLLTATFVPHRWVWTPPGEGDCSNTICTIARFRPDPLGPMTPIEDAEVTVERVYTSGSVDVYEDYTTCMTDADGTCCVPTPDPMADPVDAPTVDPVGGGTSGGTLPVGTYVSAVTSTNHYGETRLSPESAEFQVGIPNAVTYPTLSPPTLHDTQLAAGGLLAVGTYYAIVVYTDGAGHTNLGTSESGFAFDVNTLGDIPRITVPSLSLRPNAVDFRVYLSPDSDEGPFRLYLSGQTTTSIVPMSAAYNPAGATQPSSNTSLKGIPRVSWTPDPDSVADHVWAIAQSFTFHRYKSATSSPVDLTGIFIDQALPTTNATGYGRFRITCDPLEHAPQKQTVTIGAECVNVGFDFPICGDCVDAMVAAGITDQAAEVANSQGAFTMTGSTLVGGIAVRPSPGCAAEWLGCQMIEAEGLDTSVYPYVAGTISFPVGWRLRCVGGDLCLEASALTDMLSADGTAGLIGGPGTPNTVPISDCPNNVAYGGAPYPLTCETGLFCGDVAYPLQLLLAGTACIPFIEAPDPFVLTFPSPLPTLISGDITITITPP